MSRLEITLKNTRPRPQKIGLETFITVCSRVLISAIKLYNDFTIKFSCKSREIDCLT